MTTPADKAAKAFMDMMDPTRQVCLEEFLLMKQQEMTKGYKALGEAIIASVDHEIELEKKLKDVEGALRDCLDQMEQMEGMFPDDDGQISEAMEAGYKELA